MQRYAFPRENGVKWRRENQWTEKRKSTYCYHKQPPPFIRRGLAIVLNQSC